MQRKYFIFHKPYGYLSQFTDEGRWKGLHQILDVPKDVYSVGRLDADSEGLLILTNDKTINNNLLDPKKKHPRVYLAQVEHELASEAITNIMRPLTIRIGKRDYKTLPAKARIIPEPTWLEERTPPIRERKSIPTSWLELSLIEGKNRQVRKMTAAVGHPTLRLIRYSIENLSIENLKQGQLKEISEAQIKAALYL